MLEQLKSRPKELKGVKPIITKKSQGYRYLKVDFYVIDPTLYFKLWGSKPVQWFRLDDINRHSAREIILSVDFGRHFEDGILEIYKEMHLDLGYFSKSLALINQKYDDGFAENRTLLLSTVLQ